MKHESTNRTSSVVVTEKAYAYDANGNLTNDTRFAYEWDCENRLAAVRDAATGALVQENRYDALWRRREKIDYAADGTATTNRYLYKDWLVLAITDGKGNVLETYTHGADLSGEVGGSAGGIGGILASTQAGGVAVYAYDFNGNVVGVTDASGVVVSSLSYTPFGEVLARTGSFTPRYQFSTKERDSGTGLNYYGYRFYSPNLGRWMNRDPLGELSFRNTKGVIFSNRLKLQSDKDAVDDVETAVLQDSFPNLLASFENNPVNFIDVSGLNAFGVGGSIAGSLILIDGPIPAGDALAGLILLSCAIHDLNNSSHGCYPCKPPVGTVAYEVDWVPPGRHHRPHKGTHTHHLRMNQSPWPVCKCFWKRNYVRSTDGVSPLPGEIPLEGDAEGGGVY